MYSSILIATDGSELADKALEHGLSLAKRFGSKVLIVTVTEMMSPWGLSDEYGLGAAAAIEAYEAAETEYAKKVLGAAGEQARKDGVAASLRHVSDRRASDGIIEAALDAKSDLIVMASHGRRGLNRVLLGSQTSAVLALSDIPVLVVK